MSANLSDFKCQKCKEFLVFGDRRGYTWGAEDCSHYYCSACSTDFETARNCPVKGCRVNDHATKTERNLNDSFKKQFDKMRIPTCETHEYDNQEFICTDPDCDSTNHFECPECFKINHKKCHEHSLKVTALIAKSLIRVARYRELIPTLKDKLTQKQLVCPKLEVISNFIDGRITKLCNLETEFFIPGGFRSKYELTTEGKDIVVHDKVLKQVEPLVWELLKDWETKSLDKISAGMVEIGQLCDIQNAVVDREVKPHILKTTRPAAPLPPSGMDEAKLARHVDLA